MKAGKRSTLYALLAISAVAIILLLIVAWQNHRREQKRLLERLEGREGLLIQILQPDETLQSGSAALQKAVSEFRRDIKDGYAPLKIVTDQANNEVALIRILPEGRLQQAGARILDHEDFIQSCLRDLQPLHEELSDLLRRLVYRLEAVPGPVFQDEAFRIALHRAEKLWQKRNDRIEELDAQQRNGGQSRRTVLKQQIAQTQDELRKVDLSDTDRRVPLIKELRRLQQELASIPAQLSPAARALQDYPLLFLNVTGSGQLFTIPQNVADRQKQIDLYRRWLTLESADLLRLIREDLQAHPTTTIEVRRAALHETVR